jgi:regulatory protein
VRRPPARLATPQSRPAGALRLAALRLLGRRDYTTAELTARLIHRGYVPEEVAATVARLVADGSLDDRRAARNHVRIATHVKSRGRVRILGELRARGIDEALAREALADLPAENDRRAVERLLARHVAGAPLAPADRHRLFRKLLRRGFPADVIAAALDKSTLDAE